jgi:2-iminoacetate synthase
VPRFKPAFGSPLAAAPSPVSDADFEKVVVLYRLAVPSAGVVVSTREPAALRERCLDIGASQVSAGSKVDPGGYASGERKEAREQFPVGDTRTLDEVVAMVLDRGHVPSLCTACYREGRTGDTFTELALDGHVRDFCLPNALLTLAEYAVEREPGDLRERCLAAVRREEGALAGSPVEDEFRKRLARTLAGEKDLHF